VLKSETAETFAVRADLDANIRRHRGDANRGLGPESPPLASGARFDGEERAVLFASDDRDAVARCRREMPSRDAVAWPRSGRMRRVYSRAGSRCGSPRLDRRCCSPITVEMARERIANTVGRVKSIEETSSALS